MKNFIYKVSSFLFPILLFGLFLFAMVKYSIRQNLSVSDSIIIGDSHIKFIDLPNTYNHTIDGSAYFAYYSFIKEFAKSIRNKKIFLAFNYHNLSNLYENRLNDETLWPGWKEYNTKKINKFNLYNKYKFEGINKDFGMLKSFDFEEYFNDLEVLLKPVKKNSTETIVDTTIINKSIFNHWLNPKNILEDKIQREFLKRIILLLKRNGNEVVLLKMPVTIDYYNNVPVEIKNELESYAQLYDVRLLDLHNELELQDDYSLFKDYGHLNIKGDSIVKNYLLRNELSSNLLIHMDSVD